MKNLFEINKLYTVKLRENESRVDDDFFIELNNVILDDDNLFVFVSDYCQFWMHRLKGFNHTWIKAEFPFFHPLNRHDHSTQTSGLFFKYYSDLIGNELTNKSGKIGKRIKRVFETKWGINLTNETMGKIGQLVREHIVHDEYIFDFDDDFSWARGDFGDKGSCFFGGMHDNHRIMMRDDNHFSAIRMFKHSKRESSGKYHKGYLGNSRAWVYWQKDYMVVFNAYGDFDVLDFGSAVCRHLNNQIDFTVESEKYICHDDLSLHGGIYLNGDKAIIGKEITINRIDSITMNIGTMYRCVSCGDRYHDDDDMFYCGYCGGLLCDYCDSENHSYCGDCGERIHHDNEILVNGEWCEYCAKRNHNYIECESCGELTNEHTNNLCLSCFDDYSIECKLCGDYYLEDNIIEYDDDNYCNGCIQNLVTIQNQNESCFVCGTKSLGYSDFIGNYVCLHHALNACNARLKQKGLI